jgi:hypothetical protein
VYKITTSSAVISFDPGEGFLRVTSNPVDEITMADTRRDFGVAAEMVNYNKTPVMADSRHYTHFTDEIRRFYASKEAAERISAMAIIICSLPTRIIGNFFIKMHKPLYPTRLFNTEEEASKWLCKYVLVEEKI